MTDIQVAELDDVVRGRKGVKGDEKSNLIEVATAPQQLPDHGVVAPQ